MAVYFTYKREIIFLAFVILLVLQASVGLWRRRKGVGGALLPTLRLLLIPIVLVPLLYLGSYGAVWRGRIRFTLLGDVPNGISELKTYEDIWTNYVITMRFRAEPESVRRIVTSARFQCTALADDGHRITYEPVNRHDNVLHRISVSNDFREVFIEYAAD